ncbi:MULTISPECIES: AraC family transcriptional regulator [Dyadobacter]|uniref:AraC family transcriptional regulator n=1 Tax=Dyadobacter chenhuakuii TaxID=2909339 RepID=A0ABY4XPG4_9BACT|nr:MULTISPECIES: AraC family transcriptional regulator [Dyadobacter]MCF2493438.1 AraC family transcriptional regulator [Dyadobacter chenhuakuii]MCF2517180.1 AraC family transcriptional regulator [Dyadobacter sp. CY351]USJ32285.1 AraC family transcriptional regulator [Dyadobacter chenhuakuii]
MRTINFNKTECGVDFLLNVLPGDQVKDSYTHTDIYNTDYFEILFFKKAEGSVILNSQKMEISNNSIVFISAFQKRQWNLSAGHIEFTSLVFQEDFLNEFFADKLFTYRLLYFYQLQHPLKMAVTSQQMSKSCEILTEIKTELVSVRPDSAHIIRSQLYYLLQTLNRQYSSQNNLSTGQADTNYAYQFKRLLETHIRQKQRINDYTEMLGISRISLNKGVKAAFNVTATQLIKRRLLSEIQSQLIYTDKTTSEIAYEYGFSEPNHLMRFFKTLTNETISEFLSNHPRNMKAVIDE